MDVRSLGFRSDLMMRRLAGADVDDRGDHVVVRTPANPTFYWGNFLLAPGPLRRGDGARWLAEFARAIPDATHRAIGVDGTDGDPGDADDLRAAGLAPDVSTVLTARRVRAPARPPVDAALRALSSDADWAASVALRLAVDDLADDPGHQAFVAARQHEQRTIVAAGHGVYVGAFVEGRLVAGLGLYTDGCGLARFQTVETHPDHRRRGLATALLVEADRLVRAVHDVRQLVIVADPGYVAIEAYRAVGFADAERQVQWQRGPDRSGRVAAGLPPRSAGT